MKAALITAGLFAAIGYWLGEGPLHTWGELPVVGGGFVVALRSALSILPVGLEGPRLVLPPGKGVVRPQPVIVRIGRPIPTQDLGISSRRALTDKTRCAIDRLRGSAGHLRD